MKKRKYTDVAAFALRQVEPDMMIFAPPSRTAFQKTDNDDAPSA